RSAGRIPRIAYASLGGHIGECPVPIVAVKDVGAQAGDVNIGPAIIVIVARRAAVGPAGGSDAGLVGHVRKSTIVIVVVKGATRGLVLQGHVHCRRIGEINIQPAIAVVIQKQNAAAHGFGNVLLFGRVGVAEANAGLFGNVFELWNRAVFANGGLQAWRRRRRGGGRVMLRLLAFMAR